MRPTPSRVRVPRAASSLRWLAWAGAIGWLATHSPCKGQILSIGATPPGIVETGVPNFAILGPEVLGLRSAPTFLATLPDGRYVVAARDQIAFGDGTRWEVFDRAAGSPGTSIDSFLTDRDGRMFAGFGDGIGRLIFLDAGQWRMEEAAELTAEDQRHPGLARAEQVGDTWYWYGESGTVATWQGTGQITTLGVLNVVSRIFALGNQVFVSDSANGRLYRVVGQTLAPTATAEAVSGDHTVTAAAPLDRDHVLVATFARGIRTFDGTHFASPPMPPILAGPAHITDLIRLPGDLYAAAVDGFGVVLFTASGKIVQTLDRGNDHRLARIRRLIPTPNGELWALLNSGIARIEIPSPVSHLEPLVENGVSFALPTRHDGRLWICADGVALRGSYDNSGRLLEFRPDSPPGRYVYSMLSVPKPNLLFAGTDTGLFALFPHGWEQVVPGPENMRLLDPFPGEGRWFYSAVNEVGWLRLQDDHFVAERVRAPGLGDAYGGTCDRDGVAWIELGTGRCARVDLRQPQLRVEMFDTDDGLENSWVQLFLFHDEIRVDVAGRVLRFDPATKRFATDTDFERRYPHLFPNLAGRPVHDSAGRFWVTVNGNVNVFDDSGPEPRPITGPNLLGLGPYYFVTQPDGVVWMHRNNYLIRYDPAFPQATLPPVRALITRVHLTADNRKLTPRERRIPPVPFISNSLAIQFVAPGAPLGAPLSFETRLEGASDAWTSAGASGSAVFPRLKEGSYVLHVRPRFGGATGLEDELAFVVLPPWYRSTTAYLGYGLSALAVFGGFAWLASFMERREKIRLARLVAERTRELDASNQRLIAQVDATTRKADELRTSEERYRGLSAELEQRVHARTEELEAFAYSVSHDLRAPLRNISGFAELLHKHLRGRIEPAHARYLDLVSNESVRLGHLIDSLLAFSRIGRTDLQITRCDLGQIVTAVRDELQPALAGRAVTWRIGPLPAVEGDATLLRQVFANLLGNAVKFTGQHPSALIEVGQLPAAAGTAEHIIFVRDDGAGFDPQYANKLFGVFQRLHRASEFEGTGIGLANVRRIVARHGGRVWAEGRPGEGATFFLAIPANPQRG